MKIRHEINILTTPLIASNGAVVTSNEQFYFDITKLSGTFTTQFEAVYTNTGATTGGFSLRRSGGGGSGNVSFFDASVTNKLERHTVTTAITQTEAYSLEITAPTTGTLTVKAARIIIIQDTGSDPLTASESQFEIGVFRTAFSVTTPSASYQPKYWKYEADKWDGTKTFYFEAVGLTNNSMYEMFAYLQVADGTGDGFVGWSTVATLSTSNTTATRMRSTAFTPVDGRNYRVAVAAGNSMGTCDFYCAKIIVQQTETVTQGDTEIYYIDGSDGINTGTFWSDGSNAFDSDDNTFATCTKDGSNGSEGLNSLKGEGTNAPTSSSNLIFSVSARGLISKVSGTPTSIQSYIYLDGGGSPIASIPIAAYLNGEADGGPPIYTGWETVSVPSGGWDWNKISNLEFKCWPGGLSAVVFKVYKVEIRVILKISTPITKLQDQYLLANTALAAGTANQNFLTKWDSAEWDGVTNEYIHAVDASDNDTSVVDLRDASSNQLSGSVVTAPDNSEVGGYGTIHDVIGGNPIGRPLNNDSGKGQAFYGTGNYIYGGSFALNKTGSPTGTIYFRLYAGTGTLGTNATATGSPIAEATMDVTALLTTGTQIINFTFASPASITDGNLYVLMCEFIGDDSNYINIYQTTITTGNGVNENLTTGAFTSTSVDYAMRVRSSFIMPSTAQNIDVRATTNSGNLYASRIIANILKYTAPPASRRAITRARLIY